VIYAIAPSRLADHDLWIGTDDGLIWRSKDEGQHWANVTPSALTPWSKIGILDTSHFDAETAYAAVDRHRLDDFKPYIYRTHDGGQSWQLIANGIPEGSFVNAVREDSVRKGLLYAGTEKGVYMSLDDGDHWQPLQTGLPVTSVRDIEVHGKDVVIATHGRAFWVLDDVTPLRQIDAAAQQKAAWLFAPSPAIRLHPAGVTGSPMPKDEAAAPDPPFGAYVDYVLKTAAKQPVTLEIHDEQGGLVRRYSSADPMTKPDLAKLTTAPEWVIPPSVLSTAPGMHRFAWPLRYAAPAALSEGGRRRSSADGVWAPPGSYTLVLEVDGTRLTQPLTVVPDPRLTLRQEDYARQFALARRIEDARARVATVTHENGALLKALAERRQKAGPEITMEIDTLQARATEIVGPASQGFGLPPTAAPTSLIFASDALDKLANAVDGSDSAPSPDAVAGFEQIQPALTAGLAAWDTFKTKDLAALNARLKKARQQIVSETE
jgi:hypothetical protein